MENSLQEYLIQIELMGFFSGYVMIYLLVKTFCNSHHKYGSLFSAINKALPYAYGITGLLYLGFLLKNMYPNYTGEYVELMFKQHYIRVIALLSLLCWLPLFRKNAFWSAIHSLIFFLFIVKDIAWYFIYKTVQPETIQNDMTVFFSSLLLNLSTLSFTVLVILLFKRFSAK